jgi:hypothetical protein
MSTLNTFKVVDKLNDCYTYNRTSGFMVNSTSLDSSASDYFTTNYDKTTNTLTYNIKTAKLTANTTIRFTAVLKYNSNIKSNVGKAIENTAQVVYSTKTGTTSSNDTTNTINSNTVETHTGGFYLIKTDSSGNALEGATFKIYKTLDDAKADTKALSFYDKDGTSLTTTSTSNSKGYFYFYGLSYGSSGEEATTSSSTTYYIVETSAPTGYNLLSEPIAVKVDKNTIYYPQIVIKNSLKTEIPFTGGFGTAIFTVIGVVIILCGVIFICVWKKKKLPTTNNEEKKEM